jgi:hypothetical protein
MPGCSLSRATYSPTGLPTTPQRAAPAGSAPIGPRAPLIGNSTTPTERRPTAHPRRPRPGADRPAAPGVALNAPRPDDCGPCPPACPGMMRPMPTDRPSACLRPRPGPATLLALAVTLTALLARPAPAPAAGLLERRFGSDDANLANAQLVREAARSGQPLRRAHRRLVRQPEPRAVLERRCEHRRGRLRGQQHRHQPRGRGGPHPDGLRSVARHRPVARRARQRGVLRLRLRPALRGDERRGRRPHPPRVRPRDDQDADG